MWKEATYKTRALLLVAHPDDETIFCGGTMLSYPNWEWSVVCMTQDKNSQRYAQFEEAMDRFKKLGVNIASYFTLEQVDNGQDLNTSELTRWQSKISDLHLNPDLVLTHNTEGEYGHVHHRALNKIAKDEFSNVWEFICPGAINVAPQPFKKKIQTVPLTSEVLDKKTQIFNLSYTSELYIWKNLSDLMIYEFKTGPEIFTSE